jgi:hypothetical protein
VAAGYHRQALSALDAAHGDIAALAEIGAITERLLGRTF